MPLLVIWLCRLVTLMIIDFYIDLPEKNHSNYMQKLNILFFKPSSCHKATTVSETFIFPMYPCIHCARTMRSPCDHSALTVRSLRSPLLFVRAHRSQSGHRALIVLRVFTQRTPCACRCSALTNRSVPLPKLKGSVFASHNKMRKERTRKG